MRRLDVADPAERVAAHHRSGTGITRVPYPAAVHHLTVRRRALLTPRMLRLTLTGPGLAGFHSYQCDDHVRIVFADADGTRRDPVPNSAGMLDWLRPMPPTRKYTVRRLDRVRGELDLDVVLHDGGYASTLLARLEPGEPLVVTGPTGAKAFPHTYGHYLLAVDATGLPAATRLLEEVPVDATATLVVEVDSAAEHGYPLPERAGLTVVRLTRDGGSRLAPAALEQPHPDRPTFLLAAGEAGDLQPLRSWAKGRWECLISGYWKRGVANFPN